MANVHQCWACNQGWLVLVAAKAAGRRLAAARRRQQLACLADRHYRGALVGAFQPGTSFEWTSYGFTVISTIYAVAERARVLWGGTADGITGVHEWVFSRTPAGVHLTTEESFAGDPVQSDVTGMQSALDGSLVAWLGIAG
jgi:hypothetical protein